MTKPVYMTITQDEVTFPGMMFADSLVDSRTGEYWRNGNLPCGNKRRTFAETLFTLEE